MHRVLRAERAVRDRLECPDRIDDAVLALAYLTLHDGVRVWRSTGRWR